MLSIRMFVALVDISEAALVWVEANLSYIDLLVFPEFSPSSTILIVKLSELSRTLCRK